MKEEENKRLERLENRFDSLITILESLMRILESREQKWTISYPYEQPNVYPGTTWGTGEIK